MLVGVPREVKNHEYRVAITPAGVHELTRHGHDVVIEQGAGLGSSIHDDEYVAAGAKILDTADAVWAEAELILKVKEPIAEEYGRMRRGQTLFTYLHLAASRECTDALLSAGTTSIAYETVQLPDRSLPLLAPMSEVAGRLAPQVGFYHLMRSSGGRGVLPGGVPGVYPADVVVIGAGVSGVNAAQVARGMGARVEILDLNVAKLRQVDAQFAGTITTVASNAYAIEKAVATPTSSSVRCWCPAPRHPSSSATTWSPRCVPARCWSTSRSTRAAASRARAPTTHDDPTFKVHDSVFYCVANMPGAVPHTSTYALTNVTLPYAVALADKGWKKAVTDDAALAGGLSTHDGHLVNAAVGEALDLEVTPLSAL